MDDIDRLIADVERLYGRDLPKESKKFLRKNARRLARLTKRKAKQLGIDQQSDDNKAYYSRFKSGKVYKYNGQLSIRSYNSSPHAHLLEHGHMMVTHDGREVS